MQSKKSIKNWAEEDRPRERLLVMGKKSMTNAELLAIILGSGSVKMSAVDLAREMLLDNSNNLRSLAQCELNQLTKFKGIGEAKALVIIAVMELANRYEHSKTAKRTKITSSKEAYQHMASRLTALHFEEFCCAYLSTSNEVLGTKTISSGGVAEVLVDPKKVFKYALEYSAKHIILYHNHPSGSTRISQSDRLLTSKLSEGAAILDIKVLDHIIVAGEQYVSFSDEGLM